MRNHALKFSRSLFVTISSSPLVWAGVLSLHLTVSAAEWQVSDQPNLQRELDNALPLEVELLGKPARNVGQFGVTLVPHRNSETYDALVFYAQKYRTHERVYIVNLATGDVRKQSFPEWEGKARIEMGFTWIDGLAADGKLYAPVADYSKWERGGGIVIFAYDPAVGRIEEKTVIPNAGGERNPLSVGPDGALYGAGTWISDDPDNDPNHHHVSTAYRYDPRTGEVRQYGPVGPPIDGTAYGYHFGVDDQYMYVASGATPWYLVAIHIESGEQKVLATAPDGGYPTRMQIWDMHPGARAFVQTSDDESSRKDYWLWHGELIPRERDDKNPPWAPTPSPREQAPPEPEIHHGQLLPNANNRAVLWYRLPQDRPKENRSTDASPEQQGWRKIVLEDVQTHAYPIHRLQVLPDGRIFGAAQGYYARFLFDPATDQATPLGQGGGSIYALTTFGDKLYMTGYPSAVLYAYDPSREWTVDAGQPPGQREPLVSSPLSNPRRVHEDQDEFFSNTRVKKMFDFAIGADGRIYFGGKGQRDYDGGGLAWYDPATDESGGMWKPFDRDADSIYWLTTALDDRYIVIATRGGKIFLYDTQTQQLTDRIITPVPAAPRGSGPLVEVAPGRLIGTTYAPDGGGIIYGIDLASEQPVAFQKKIPAALPFQWGQGSSHWGFTRGRDGRVYTFLGNALVRIRPADAHVEVLGRTSPGRMVFVDDDLYLAGEEELRRVRNIRGLH